MEFKHIIEHFESKPKKLFFIDGLGAILSAFLLGVVLVQLKKYIGIPPSTLYFLATLPILFAVYDFYCYRRKNNRIGQFLQAIAIINLSYCVISIGFAFYHINTITYFGWTYIIIEILIVVTLAVVEFKVAKRIISKNDQT